MKIQPHLTILVLLLCFVLQTSHARVIHDTDTTKRLKFLIIPTFFVTPEVGLAYGVSGSFAFKTSFNKDSLTRTSIIQGIGFLNTRQQNVQAIDASIYFPKENYILLGQLAHSYFPDRFWGLGPETKDKPFEHYLYEQYFINPHLKKKIAKHLWIGALYEFQYVNKISGYPENGKFDTAPFKGKKKYQVSGAGLSISYDTRNTTFWTSKGILITSQFTNFRKKIQSDYDLVKWITDVRYFYELNKSHHILAMQFYNYQTYGQTPLRELSAFGGSNNMRGFYQGRYRANSMITFITEYRLPIYGRFSSIIFGGIGDVYNQYSDLSLSNLKYSYGAGLRFSILAKEKLNIRVDYGFSSKFNRGIYVTFGECF